VFAVFKTNLDRTRFSLSQYSLSLSQDKYITNLHIRPLCYYSTCRWYNTLELKKNNIQLLGIIRTFNEHHRKRTED